MKKYYHIFLLSVLALVGCEKDELEKRGYPVISTSIIEVSSDGVLVSGQVLNQSLNEIIERGFYWGIDEELKNKLVLGLDDDFKTLLNDQDIFRGQAYFIRAFARTSEYLSLGNIEVFETRSFKREEPIITSLSQLDVIDFDEVVIKGQNFTSITDSVAVKLGDLNVQITYSSHDTIRFVVPEGLSSGAKSLNVKVYGKSVNYTGINVKAPVISTISQFSAFDGTDLTLLGSNFSENVSVNFNGSTVPILSKSENEIQFRTPLTTKSGVVKIYVQTSGGKKSSELDFTIVDHQITQITPAQTKVGDLVTLVGSGFIQGLRTSSVTVEGVAAEIKSISENEIQFRLPNHNDVDVSTVQVTNGSKNRNTTIVKEKSWRQLSDFPGAVRRKAVALTTKTGIYFGLGEDRSWPYPNDLWVLNSEGNWSQELTNIDPKYAFAHDDELYFGSIMSTYGVFSKYNTLSKQFTSLNAGDYLSGNSASDKSRNGVVLNQKCYITRGNWLLSYDLEGDTWSYVGSYGSKNAILLAFGNYIYIAREDGKIYRFDPQSNLNALQVDLNLPLDLTCFTQDQSKFYFGGGGQRITFYEVDLETFKVIRREDLPRIISQGVAFKFQDEIWIGSGADAVDLTNEFWAFDPN